MIRSQLFGLAFLSLVAAGCGGGQVAPAPGGGKATVKKENPLDQAADLLRKGSTAANFRETLTTLNALLAKADRDRLEFSKEDRALLAREFSFTPEEWTELESTTFRLLDAHHLEYCYLMRDVARALEVEGLSPLAQASLCFDWVTRQVRLAEGNTDVLPPTYVLQSGKGNSVERILVFLGLLHQLPMDGCAVKISPSAEATPIYLAGVRIADEKGEKSEIRLFDPRLGLPVAVPGGIATLAQVRKQPELVAGLKAGAEPQVEVLFAAPLSALSPRMQVLEDWLAPQDRVMLAVAPTQTIARLASAADLQVKAWVGEAKAIPPLRILRSFLPPEEGGIDQAARWRLFPRQILPLSAVRLAFIDWKITEFVPPAEERLLFLTALLFNQYSQTPQDMLVRGRYDFLSKRLNSVRTVLDDLEFAGTDTTSFKSELEEWREVAKQVLLGAGKGAEARANQFWNEDQFLVELLQNPDDRDPKRAQQKKILTTILFTAARDSIGPDVAYRQALAWQEKAERAQAALSRQQADSQYAQDNARSSWINAGDWWRKFAERTSLSPTAVASKLEPISRRWGVGDIDTSLALWDQLGRDLQYAALARFYHARASLHLDKAEFARTTLQTLENDLAALEKNAALSKGLAACIEQSRGSSQVALRLQAVMKDALGEGGALYWLRQRVALQLKELSK